MVLLDLCRGTQFGTDEAFKFQPSEFYEITIVSVLVGEHDD